RQARNSRALWTAAALALVYGAALYALGAHARRPLLEGAAGVILGLYICSHPAANAVDFLIMSRVGLRQLWSRWSGLGWLTLNAAVMLIGWLVIVVGATRLVG